MLISIPNIRSKKFHRYFENVNRYFTDSPVFDMHDIIDDSSIRKCAKGMVLRKEDIYSIINDPNRCCLVIPRYSHYMDNINPGDWIWVKENYKDILNTSNMKEDILYSTDDIEGFKPSITMPKDKCRLYLKVKNTFACLIKNIDITDLVHVGFYPGENISVNHEVHEAFVNYYDNMVSRSKVENKSEYMYDKNPMVYLIYFEPYFTEEYWNNINSNLESKSSIKTNIRRFVHKVTSLFKSHN